MIEILEHLPYQYLQLTLSLLVVYFVLCLLITYANSLDPDQDIHNVGPGLDPNHFTLIMFLKEFFLKVKESVKL